MGHLCCRRMGDQVTFRLNWLMNIRPAKIYACLYILSLKIGPPGSYSLIRPKYEGFPPLQDLKCFVNRNFKEKFILYALAVA